VGTKRASLEEVRERVLGLPGRLRPEAVNGLAAEWELRLGDAVFTVAVARGACKAREGPSDAPASRVTTDLGTWLALDEGRLTGTDALIDRRLAVRGNLDLAARLQILFEPHGRLRVPTDVEQVDVDADGHRLSVYLAGDPQAPPVLLLHGLGGSKISWLTVVPALAERYRVIAPDLPGHGESEKPVADYAPRMYARAARRTMDAFGAERAVVIGNSLGGRVALEMAIRAPDRLRGLALLDPAVPGVRLRPLLGFARVIPSELGRLPFPLRERWMVRAVRRLFGDPAALPDEAYLAAADEFIRVYRDPAARMAFVASLRHLLTEPARDLWGRVRKIRMPALVIWGTADRLVPVRLATRLGDALPRGEVLILPGVGHVPQFEAPDEVKAALLRFLGELPA
jgi:pimeloyl-ACP methyl ester carboxylesterase/putative sterol carrier protein